MRVNFGVWEPPGRSLGVPWGVTLGTWRDILGTFLVDGVLYRFLARFWTLLGAKRDAQGSPKSTKNDSKKLSKTHLFLDIENMASWGLPGAILSHLGPHLGSLQAFRIENSSNEKQNSVF